MKYSLSSIAKKTDLKTRIIDRFGEEAYTRLRLTGVNFDKKLSRQIINYRQAIHNRPVDNKLKQLPKFKGLHWGQSEPMKPSVAYSNNYKIVVKALNSAGIKWWRVAGINPGRFVVGLDVNDRSKTLEALTKLHWSLEAPVYVMNADGPNPQIEVAGIPQVEELNQVQILRVVSPVRTPQDDRKYGFSFGCDIEFWDVPEARDSNSRITAPRENKASRILGWSDFELENIETDIGPVFSPKIFQQRMLDDVDFEIDAVYTWVDGEDPAWLESKLRLQAEIGGTEFHSEAVHAARFRSRDELKYSLRSLEYFAPWFRKIFIVTANQVPDWLDVNHPKIHVISHREIYDNKEHLPTFNSNSIISRLHHIPGLSDHYVYINDDVLFGRQVTKEHFFSPSGIALVSPSNNRRPFGSAELTDEPHINLTRNMRELIKTEFNVVISRAIKHTPHPMIKSVLFEMEERFRETFSATWNSRFRHHTDIVSDQLHHYFAQLTGRAVPGALTYNYINVLDNKYLGVLNDTLKWRNRDAFCVNDAPVEGAEAISEDQVNHFFETYFPVKSSFEL